MLSAAQQRAYDRDGYVILRGAISAAACARMEARLWEGLEAVHGIRRDAPETWTRPMPRRLQALSRAGAFRELAAPTLLAAADAILGVGTWDPPRHWGAPLPVFPTPGPWRLPARMWHLDAPVRGGLGPRFGTKALCLLAPVRRRGGGTLLLEGSHRLAARTVEEAAGRDAGRSADVRRRLARVHPWLGALFSRDDRSDRVRRFMEEGCTVEGVPLRVVEVTGEAGDVVFFHPWLLHDAAPNCARTPRLMLGQSLPTRRARGPDRGPAQGA